MTNDSPIQPNSNDELTNPIEIPNLEPQNQLESRIRPTNTTPSNSPDSDQLPERFQPRSTHRETVDAKLVNQTKNQIRLLVQEIADLAKSDCSVEEFYEGFLTRTTNALASTGGAIWVRDSIDEPLKLHYHINLKQTNLATDKKAQSQHSRLLCKLAEQGEPTLVSPASGSADEMSGNPTDSLLVVGPLKIDNATLGLVEIFQRPGAGPTTQRGYLRFLLQMCDIASDFLCNRRIRSFAQQQMMWQQLEHFMRLIHQGLDTDQTVFTLANEGRRLIDCDRCSVAIGYGRNCLIKAVSGLDSIERRAEQVKKLSSLSASVVRTGQPLWYTGEDDELPPQLEKKMHAYVDKSHTKMLAIIPLFESDKDSEDTAPASPRDREKRKPMGALVVEQLKDSRITPGLKKRTEIVVQHGQTALTNATEHNRIFLMPVWKGLGKLTRAFDTGNRLKSATIIGFLVGISAFLCLFPYSFGLGANGSLTPQTQREIFSQTSGTMIEVNVSDSGDTVVETGSVLAVLKNTDIELEISKLIGEIAIYDQDVKSYTRLQGGTGRERLSSLELHEVNSKARQAEQAIESLKNELQIRQHEQELLQIKSPISGCVVNWNIRSNLINRPVEQGQSLMTVVPPNTPWQIELEMPERRMAHLLRAQKKSKSPLRVTFGLVSNPGHEYEGEILRIDRKLDVYSDDGNSALVRVAFPNDSIDPELLRAETRVTAKVHCGTRSIGYVMFHELIETVQSSVMLWF